MSPGVHRAFGLFATAVIVGAVVWGFTLVGSPASRREERLDERRVEDLQAIVVGVVSLCTEGGRTRSLVRPLPASLEELPQWRGIPTEDPEGHPYGYRVLDDRRFELCASFDGARDAATDVFWDHPPGRACFVVDVLDPP